MGRVQLYYHAGKGFSVTGYTCDPETIPFNPLAKTTLGNPITLKDEDNDGVVCFETYHFNGFAFGQYKIGNCILQLHSDRADLVWGVGKIFGIERSGDLLKCHLEEGVLPMIQGPSVAADYAWVKLNATGAAPTPEEREQVIETSIQTGKSGSQIAVEEIGASAQAAWTQAQEALKLPKISMDWTKYLPWLLLFGGGLAAIGVYKGVKGHPTIKVISRVRKRGKKGK